MFSRYPDSLLQQIYRVAMNHNIHRPRTLIPPPAPYAIAILTGWWIDRNIQPFGWGLDATLHPLGWLSVAAGLALLAWTTLTLWAHRTTVNPYKAVSTLCTAGPFRYSRNPIYLGDWLIFIGTSILLSTWWPLFFSPFIWAMLRYGVIRHEEAHLETRFGETYRNYKARVRRWL